MREKKKTRHPIHGFSLFHVLSIKKTARSNANQTIKMLITLKNENEGGVFREILRTFKYVFQ